MTLVIVTYKRLAWHDDTTALRRSLETGGHSPHHRDHGRRAQNLTFYTDALGLRLVKKSVNQDDPTVYHLFYADEEGGAGSDITFFEYPNAARGARGAGMVHRITWRVGSSDALDFWASRLADGGVTTERDGNKLLFDDPEGLGLELAVVETTDEPLSARHPEIPQEFALQGFDGVRVYSANPAASKDFLESTMNFDPDADVSWIARGEQRGGFYAYDEAPEEPGLSGAGTVHHVAWATPMDEHTAWHKTGPRGRGGRHSNHRSLLLQVHLLPRTFRGVVRDRNARPGFRRRRAEGVARRTAGFTSGLRTST